MMGLAEIFHQASMGLTSVVTYIHRYRFKTPLDLRPILGLFLKYILPYLFTLWMFFLIYRIIPYRKIHHRIALKVAFFISLLWEVSKQFFGWYVFNIGRFSMVYDSLSALIIIFFWIYYSTVILVLGAEAVYLL